MGYLHIDNLYTGEAQDLLMFKELYAMEKIHGTSAHVRWGPNGLVFRSGGEKHERFVELFDSGDLAMRFVELGHDEVTVYGEAYGGKCQGMRKTYGDHLRFVAFDVTVSETWVTVPNAWDIATKLGLDFVHYERGPATIEWLDEMRDWPSWQARRNGIEEDQMAEGIVIRPVMELVRSNGNRMIAKHKRAEFRERTSIPNIDPAKRELRAKAQDIAFEWVTSMRLTHVLDKIPGEKTIQMTGEVIKAMIADVLREGAEEIVDNAAVRKAISARTAILYKERLNQAIVVPRLAIP